MRGQKEAEDLNVVKEKLLQKDKTGKFEEKLNSDVNKHLFGLLPEDSEELASILLNAKPNNNSSEFPDFIFEKGFIEHFQITSSKETRKGAKQKIESVKFEKKVEKENKEFEDFCNSNPDFNNCRTKSWEMNNSELSYDYLVKSFKKNLEKHLKSMEKYEGEKEIPVFLVVLSNSALGMFENKFYEWKNFMYHGDFKLGENFKYYRVSRDKNLLNYLYELKDNIKYFIFLNQNCIEIIKTENIYYFLNLLPYDFLIEPMNVNRVISNTCLSIKNSK